MHFGFQELLIIFLIIILLFGARKLPQLAKGMGEAIREFRKAKKNIEKEVEETDAEIKQVQSDD